MTVEQFYKELENRGIDPKEYKKRVKLLFFLADTIDFITMDLDKMMVGKGNIGGILRHNIQKISQHSKSMVRMADISMDEIEQERFGDEGDQFKDVVYKIGNIGKI